MKDKPLSNRNPRRFRMGFQFKMFFIGTFKFEFFCPFEESSYLSQTIVAKVRSSLKIGFRNAVDWILSLKSVEKKRSSLWNGCKRRCKVSFILSSVSKNKTRNFESSFQR